MNFKYHDSLNSDHWRNLRRLAASRACERCEGMILVFDLTGQPMRTPCGSQMLTVRCEASRGLQMHHLHYESLGTEALDDVQLLCDRCHRLATVVGVCCESCGESVCGSLEDAYKFLEQIEPDRLRRPNPTESLVAVTRNKFGSRCGTCCDMGYSAD